MAATITTDYTALLLSEQAQPQASVQDDGDTEAMMLAFVEQMQMWGKWTYGRNLGGAVGSVAATWHARDGKIDMEVHNTRQLVPLWKNRRTLELAAVMKFWSVFKTEKVRGAGDDGAKETERQVEYVYRRIITEQEDLVFKPIRMDDPEHWGWEREEALCVHHGFGFFPGVWVQNTPDEADIDGEPDCQGAWKQIDALDRLMSQINKAALANADPTVVLKYDPKKIAVAGAVRTGSDQSIEPGEDGDAKFLEMLGSGIQAAERVCDRLERYISWRTGWVPIDPSKVGGAAVSSLTLKLMFRSMIQRADKLRLQYGPAIVRGLEIVLQIARHFGDASVPLPPPRTGASAWGSSSGRCPCARGKTGPSRTSWAAGTKVTIQWGPYFNATPSEDGQSIENAVKAKTGGLVDKQTAMEAVAKPVFGVRDVDAMRQRVDEEQAAEVDQLMQQAGAGVSGRALDDALGSGALTGGDTDRARPGDAPS
jgi:hypothetical protein